MQDKKRGPRRPCSLYCVQFTIPRRSLIANHSHRRRARNLPSYLRNSWARTLSRGCLYRDLMLALVVTGAFDIDAPGPGYGMAVVLLLGFIPAYRAALRLRYWHQRRKFASPAPAPLHGASYNVRPFPSHEFTRLSSAPCILALWPVFRQTASSLRPYVRAMWKALYDLHLGLRSDDEYVWLQRRGIILQVAYTCNAQPTALNSAPRQSYP